MQNYGRPEFAYSRALLDTYLIVALVQRSILGRLYLTHLSLNGIYARRPFCRALVLIERRGRLRRNQMGRPSLL